MTDPNPVGKVLEAITFGFCSGNNMSEEREEEMKQDEKDIDRTEREEDE